MKRNFIIGVISLLLLVGCGNKTNPEGVDIAKILLANERLDENDLSGNLFTSGKKAFNQIKKMTKKYSYQSKNIKSAFNKNGTRYTWSDAPEYSNFLSYFYSYADSIEYNAEKGSELIELAKTSIQTVDCWIKYDGNNQILLNVDKNSETIISRNDDQYEICRRYQNEIGQNTFEMFISNSDTNSKSRMTYIPNLRYEYTSIQDDTLLVIVADKDKGYWDIMTTSYNLEYDENNRTFSNFVMKDEAIYEITYVLERDDGNINEYFGDIKLVSSDGKSDMLSINDNQFSIFTTGINGLDCFYIDAQDNEVCNAENDRSGNYKVLYIGEGNDRSYFTDDYSSAIAKFNNEKELKKGDKLYNEIEILGTSIAPIGDVDFYGKIDLSFNNNETESNLSSLEKLMKDYGFSFKDNYDVIKEAIRFSKKDSKDFGKYYLWQGNHINDFDSIDKSIKIEKDLINECDDLYSSFKDKTVIKNNDQWNIDDSYQFSNVNIVSNGNIYNENNNISINNLSLEVENTSLFTRNTDYQISFAFAKENNGKYYDLYHLDFENSISYKFEKDTLNDSSNKLQLKQNAILELPILEEGTYILVAYVSTYNDDIRITNPISIKGNIKEITNDKEGFINTLKNNENNEICINSTQTSTINIDLKGSYTYEQLYLLLESYGYKYGNVINSDLEKENNSNWDIIDNNSNITSGTYRLKYYNNILETNAYIVAVVE